MFWLIKTNGVKNLVLDDDDMTLEVVSNDKLRRFTELVGSLGNAYYNGKRFVVSHEYTPMFGGSTHSYGDCRCLTTEGRPDFCRLCFQEGRLFTTITVDCGGIEVNGVDAIRLKPSEVKYVGYLYEKRTFMLGLTDGTEYKIFEGGISCDGHFMGKYGEEQH